MDRPDAGIEYIDLNPYRDRLALTLLELGATSEKRAIEVSTVGSWAFRCKKGAGKLTTTMQSDPGARFVLTGEGLRLAVHLNSHPPVRMASSIFGLFAGVPVSNVFPSAPLPVFALDDDATTSAATSAPGPVKDYETLNVSDRGGDDESSSEGAGDRPKRPLRRADKRKKIRKVISLRCCCSPVGKLTSPPLADTQRCVSAF